MVTLQADLLLGLIFAEQVAVQGGGEYMLGWLLTGLEDPPWATIEHHKPAGRGLATAHARLADPRLITPNLAYIRDMDTMYEKTQTTHLRQGPPPGGKPKGAAKGDAKAAADGG